MYPGSGPEEADPCCVLGWKESNGCCFFRAVANEEEATAPNEIAMWMPDGGDITAEFADSLWPRLSTMPYRGGGYERLTPRDKMKRLTKVHIEAEAEVAAAAAAKQKGAID